MMVCVGVEVMALSLVEERLVGVEEAKESVVVMIVCAGVEVVALSLVEDADMFDTVDVIESSVVALSLVEEADILVKVDVIRSSVVVVMTGVIVAVLELSLAEADELNSIEVIIRYVDVVMLGVGNENEVVPTSLEDVIVLVWVDEANESVMLEVAEDMIVLAILVVEDESMVEVSLTEE